MAPTLLLLFRQAFVDAENDFPGDVAGVGVDGVETSPWRALARHAPGAETAVGARAGVRTAIHRQRGTLRQIAIVAARDLLFDPAGERGVIRADVDVTGGGVGGGTAPVGAADAGEL